MSNSERHLGFGPDYQDDPNKTVEENRLAEVEFFKKKGIDISPDPELDKEIQALAEKYLPSIGEDGWKL